MWSQTTAKKMLNWSNTLRDSIHAGRTPRHNPSIPMRSPTGWNTSQPRLRWEVIQSEYGKVVCPGGPVRAQLGDSPRTPRSPPSGCLTPRDSDVGVVGFRAAAPAKAAALNKVAASHVRLTATTSGSESSPASVSTAGVTCSATTLAESHDERVGSTPLQKELPWLPPSYRESYPYKHKAYYKEDLKRRGAGAAHEDGCTPRMLRAEQEQGMKEHAAGHASNHTLTEQAAKWVAEELHESEDGAKTSGPHAGAEVGGEVGGRGAPALARYRSYKAKVDDTEANKAEAKAKEAEVEAQAQAKAWAAAAVVTSFTQRRVADAEAKARETAREAAREAMTTTTRQVAEAARQKFDSTGLLGKLRAQQRLSKEAEEEEEEEEEEASDPAVWEAELKEKLVALKKLWDFSLITELDYQSRKDRLLDSTGL